MLNRCVGLLLAVLFIAVLFSGSAVAQERQSLGKFTDFYGSSTVKEVGATGTHVALQESWLGQSIYKGDELVTGLDSYIQIMIESTLVDLFEKTKAVVNSTEEGLYVVEMFRGNVTAHIDTDVFQLQVMNHTVYGKNSVVVGIKVQPNRDILITTVSGAAYVDNEYGATLIVPEKHAATIKYDRLKREYIFQPSFSNSGEIAVRPKDEKETVKVPVGEEYVVTEEGKGHLRKIDMKTMKEIDDLEIKLPPFERKFSMKALVRYDWYESYKNAYWYCGEEEQFKTTSAWLGIGTKYKFAEVFLGIDAVKDNALDEIWLQLFMPEREDLLKLKIGQMRVPFGFQATQRPDELLLLEYSQSIKYAFASTQGDPVSSDLDYLYDRGLLLSGRMELLTNTYFEYSAGIFNGERRVTSESNFSKTSIARLGFNFNNKFIFGGSTYDGETTIGSERYGRLRNGFDMRINAGEFLLQAEYIWAYDNILAGKRQDLTEGFCVDIVFGLGLVSENWKKLKLIGRYDVLLPPYGLVEPGFVEQHVAAEATGFGFVWQMSDQVKFTALFESLSQGEERYTLPLEKTDMDQRAIFQFNISF